MNPKQLACFILMALIGVIVYIAQIVHQKVSAMRQEAEDAESAATNAETERSAAEIKTAVLKTETEEIRRFLRAWLPAVEKIQTQQEVEQTIELSIREGSIGLVLQRRTEPKGSTTNKLIPKSVVTTLTIEEEYAKVLNWLGDIERRLPLSRMKVVQITGGSSARQLKLDVSFETPIFDLNSANPPADKDKKKS
jgi:Na+-transporting methylmalonyl-CoA/oxaloacetate decarboxylase gamma subunit